VDGAGKGSISYRKVGTEAFENLSSPYIRKEDYGKISKKIKVQPENPKYIRNLQTIQNKRKLDITGAEVISTPRAQAGDSKSASAIVDGNYNTFFHSAYTGYITPYPHEYIIDLKEPKEYNQIDIYTRNSNTNGTIGDYELYISDDKENWTKIAEDNERKGNNNKPVGISAILDKTVSGRYFKIVAKNNKNGNNFTIISEVDFSMQTVSNNQIAQNSSKINYEGNWNKKVDGIYINGATYASTDGTFKYAIQGTSTMIYSTTDAKVQIKVDGNEWKEYNVIGAKKEPATIIRDLSNETHNIQVRVVEGELNLNLIATDGTFTTYKDLTNPDTPDNPDNPDDPSQPDNPPTEEFKFTSKYYRIEEKYISRVVPKTSFKQFKQNIETNQDIVLTDKDGKVLTDDDTILKTGMILKVGSKAEYKLAITGDVDGDGEITINDLAKLKLHYIEKEQLKGEYIKAGDLDADREITINDIAQIKLVLIDLMEIKLTELK